MPDDYGTVIGFFRRRGAYGRFKDLLDTRGKMELWYEFESRATDQALAAWCTEHGRSRDGQPGILTFAVNWALKRDPTQTGLSHSFT